MLKRILISGVVAGALVGCTDSGDVNLSPTTIDNSTSTGGGSSSNVCASYTASGQTFQGAFDGTNCTYDETFASSSRPIEVDLFIPNFGGLHIFEGSLFIGEDVGPSAAATGKRIPQEGEGPKLTVAPGNTLVFSRADSYLRIARGSQIFAQGTASSPIIMTSDEDVIAGTSNESSRGDWGGLQINGNGITNKCTDAQRAGGGNPHSCHQAAEGLPGSTYGGNNNAENSGALEYVVVKHAGFDVTDGNELNAITLNGVGSGTTISHVQAYTTQDDGFEMFGGAVNMDHIVAVNVGDDSIDYSEGYTGDIQYAVVLHTSGANRCIEGDNTGGGRPDDIAPLTKLRISNMTCITSNQLDSDDAASTSTNPSSKGSSEGPLYREGAHFEMYNSLVTSNALNLESQECLELDDTEGPQTIDAAQAGTSIARSNVIACEEALKTGADPANAGFDLENWLAGGGINAATPANTNDNNVIVTGADLPADVGGNILVDAGANARDYLTAASIQNGANVEVFDQSTQLLDVSDSANLGGGVASPIFENPSYLGGASASDNWLDGWTVGFDSPLPAN